MSETNSWVGVDLDGTLARWDGYVSWDHIGEPIMPMVHRVTKYLAEGQEVRIFTARVDGGLAAIAAGNPEGEHFRDVDRMKRVIEAWCLKHIGIVLPITNVKDYSMIRLYDDKCVQVEKNTGLVVGG